MNIEFYILSTILVFVFLLNWFCGSEDAGGAEGLTFFAGLFLIILGIGAFNQHTLSDCEATLPRDKSCVIVAVPEDKVESVREILNDK